MACGGGAVVETPADCPTTSASNANRGGAAAIEPDLPDLATIPALFGTYDSIAVTILILVVGAWGAWREWGDCSSDCGRGIRVRSRVCSKPPCRGGRQQRELCEAPCVRAAKLVSGWSAWSVWSECDASCGTGRQVRQRSCAGKRVIHY